MSNDNMTAERAIKKLLRMLWKATHKRPSKGEVSKMIDLAYATKEALSGPRVGRAALSVPDAFDMPEFYTVNRSSLLYKAGWNACRRAMLAASPEPVAQSREVVGITVAEVAPDAQQGVCCTHASLRAEVDSLRSENEALKAKLTSVPDEIELIAGRVSVRYPGLAAHLDDIAARLREGGA